MGTATEQFHIPFEELISFTSGIIGLLEYGLPWKVLKSLLSRVRHRLWRESETSTSTPALWIDNSGPRFYEVRYGMDAILVGKTDLEGSCIGRMIMMDWDLGADEERCGAWCVLTLVARASLLGVWRNLRMVKIRRF